VFDVTDLLGALVDKSLVLAEPSGGALRYRLLETIRQFAAERLAEAGQDEAAAVAAAHCRHYLSVAEAAAPHLTGSDQGSWLARLDDDQANLRRAAQHASGEAGTTDQALRFGVALKRYWMARSRAAEAVALLMPVLERSDARADPELYGMALVMTAPPPARASEIDRATLDRARAGDAMAVRAFVVRYERPVFALLSRILGPGPHVEDLAQETFLRALRALPAFDPDGAARASTWLLTIATRLALDARKKKTLRLVPLEEGFPVAGASTPETEHVRADLGRAIATAAAELSEDMRAAFVLADVHGFTMGEIAEALSIPENTAKTRVFRARQHMRERLAGERSGS